MDEGMGDTLVDRWLPGLVDMCMDERVDRWMKGWMDEFISILVGHLHHNILLFFRFSDFTAFSAVIWSDIDSSFLFHSLIDS